MPDFPDIVNFRQFSDLFSDNHLVDLVSRRCVDVSLAGPRVIRHAVLLCALLDFIFGNPEMRDPVVQAIALENHHEGCDVIRGG
jgi:hypothetical protein